MTWDMRTFRRAFQYDKKKTMKNLNPNFYYRVIIMMETINRQTREWRGKNFFFERDPL